jgi:hypothetical protein
VFGVINMPPKRKRGAHKPWHHRKKRRAIMDPPYTGELPDSKEVYKGPKNFDLMRLPAELRLHV